MTDIHQIYTTNDNEIQTFVVRTCRAVEVVKYLKDNNYKINKIRKYIPKV